MITYQDELVLFVDRYRTFSSGRYEASFLIQSLFTLVALGSVTMSNGDEGSSRDMFSSILYAGFRAGERGDDVDMPYFHSVVEGGGER